MSMNPSKVLLITLVGPYGEVDVAVRADLPAAELVPAFKELVGRRADRAGQSAGTGGSGRASAGVPPPAKPRSPPAGQPEPAPPHASETWYAPPPPPGPASAQPQTSSDAAPAGPPGPGDIPLEGTLADAGIVDGMVLYLYQPREGDS